MERQSRTLLSAAAAALIAALLLKFVPQPPLTDLRDFASGLGTAFLLGALFLGRRRTKKLAH